jgi:hypothetical protein
MMIVLLAIVFRLTLGKLACVNMSEARRIMPIMRNPIRSLTAILLSLLTNSLLIIILISIILAKFTWPRVIGLTPKLRFKQSC